MLSATRKLLPVIVASISIVQLGPWMNGAQSLPATSQPDGNNDLSASSSHLVAGEFHHNGDNSRKRSPNFGWLKAELGGGDDDFTPFYAGNSKGADYEVLLAGPHPSFGELEFDSRLLRPIFEDWENKRKRALMVSDLFTTPSRAQRSAPYQACGRDLRIMYEHACQQIMTPEGWVTPQSLESANCSAALARNQQRSRRDLVSACCRRSCTKCELLAFCFQHYGRD